MPKDLNYEQPLMVRLPRPLKRRLKIEAARMGTDMSKITRRALEDFLDRVDHEERGQRLVDELSGRAGKGMTTDEVMALTRGE